jgi:hypothetical protein
MLGSASPLAATEYWCRPHAAWVADRWIAPARDKNASSPIFFAKAAAPTMFGNGTIASVRMRERHVRKTPDRVGLLWRLIDVVGHFRTSSIETGAECRPQTSSGRFRFS